MRQKIFGTSEHRALVSFLMKFLKKFTEKERKEERFLLKIDKSAIFLFIFLNFPTQGRLCSAFLRQKTYFLQDVRQSRTTQVQVLTIGRADQRFYAPETILTSEPAHYRLCLLESKRISEGAQERPCLLERTGTGFRRCTVQLRGDNTHEWAQLIQAQLICSFLRERGEGKYKWKRMELKLKI